MFVMSLFPEPTSVSPRPPDDIALEAQVAERTRELRALLSRADTDREAEKRRIAREVHDQLGQELAAQRIAIAIAEECLDDEPVAAREKLAEVRQHFDRMLGAVDALLAELYPWVLDELGLGEAARWLARRTEAASGLRCDVSLEGDLSALDPVRSATVFRILSESLREVAAHAGATRVTIDLSAADEALFLRVRHDGDAALASSEGRIALSGLRERARALGGELTDTKTELACRLPLGERTGGAR
jgi:signal transduction histidine kinase